MVNKWGQTVYERLCEQCGGVFFATASAVRGGRGKHCSITCSRRHQCSRRIGENNPVWKGGLKTGWCAVCGREFRYAPYREKQNEGGGQYCSLVCFNRQNIGSNNGSWKGGITPLQKKIRNSKEYINWRTAVYERDDWTCRYCESRGGRLEAHHILSFAEFPEFRFSLVNGLTLCEDCHGISGRPNNQIRG